MRVGNGHSTSSRRGRVAGALFATVVTLSATAFLGGVASAAPSTATTQALVGTYIANYGHRAKPCHGLITPPWVSWLSYADATVSDEWRVYASSTSLCKLADNQAYAVISDAPHNDGAGQVLSNMLAYATQVQTAVLHEAGKPAGHAWSCAVLPSLWGRQALDLARLAHHGSPEDSDFAGAAGTAAGAGYCETRGKRDKQGQWTGGKFFSWSPDTLTCKVRYTLKEIPDPNDPGQTTNPPFPSNLWGDYDRAGC
jgi:hypothetical protein